MEQNSFHGAGGCHRYGSIVDSEVGNRIQIAREDLKPTESLHLNGDPVVRREDVVVLSPSITQHEVETVVVVLHDRERATLDIVRDINDATRSRIDDDSYSGIIEDGRHGSNGGKKDGSPGAGKTGDGFVEVGGVGFVGLEVGASVSKRFVSAGLNAELS